MRICYVSQYFPPEMEAPSARVHELSREWARAGHEVTVLTAFAHHPTGVKARRDRGVITRRELIDAIGVVRTYVYASANEGTVRRMLSYASFMLSASLIGPLRVARPDILIATSPQLLCGLAGYFIAKVLRVPFLFEVRDLWPESIIANTGLPDGFVTRRLKAIASFLYRRSDHIVTVGKGYEAELRRLYSVPPAKISIVPNGVSTELFRPLSGPSEVRDELGLGDRLVVMYVGTLGMSHGLDVVVEAARALRNRDDIVFVMVGEGAEKRMLRQQAAEYELDNFIFVDQQPRRRIPLYYAACDVGLALLMDAPIFRTVLPSKIFEYLAMDRPVITNVDGSARRLVERSGGGRFVEPGSVDSLVAAIREAQASRQDLEAAGRRGGAYVRANFDRQQLAADYLGILDKVRRGG